MTADEPVAGVPRLCARADCTRPRGHDDECGPDRADTEMADLRAEVEYLQESGSRMLAERDALQRQVDAVRSLVPSPNQPGRWVLPDDEDAPAVWVYDIDAALDVVEPADQPHPTPDACPECHHVHSPDGCTGPPSPSDLWAGVTPASCDCDWDSQQVEAGS